MKGQSEAKVRDALKTMDLRTLVYKLPDDARNWKPADFAVWWDGGTALIEVKDTDAVTLWPLRDLRESQRLGILEAEKIGLPYWLVIWWRRARRWTISDGEIVLTSPGDGSRSYSWLSSVAGIDCDAGKLPETLRSVLLGEVD